MNAAYSDRIQKKVVLSAAPARVWRALSDVGRVRRVVPNQARGSVPRGLYNPWARSPTPATSNVTVEMQVEKLEAERYFAYRWHPYAIDS